MKTGKFDIGDRIWEEEEEKKEIVKFIAYNIRYLNIWFLNNMLNIRRRRGKKNQTKNSGDI